MSRWIYEGEAVTIQKGGKPFAILSPLVENRKKPVALPDFEGRMKRIYGGRVPGGATAEEIVNDLRGDY